MNRLVYGLLFVSTLAILGCSQSKTINMKSHQFSMRPRKIIWVQVPGLHEEHTGLLKFSSNPQGLNPTVSWESFDCFGKFWSYNLYNVRPGAGASLMSQLTGKKTINNSCDDYLNRPAWQYFVPVGFEAGIFEYKTSTVTSVAREECPASLENLKGTIVWKMEKPPKKDSSTFHQSERFEFEKDKIYYDLSCQQSCFSTLSSNVQSLFDRFVKNRENYFFLVRDFSFLQATKEKNITAMRESLLEVDKVMRFFVDKFSAKSDVLILLTSADAQPMEFPSTGKEWVEFEKTKTDGVLYKRTALLSPAYATGARSENFCGIFEEADVLERLLVAPKGQGLDLSIFNFFSN